MTENPLAKVMERLMFLAMRDGTVYYRVTWDADKNEFNFTPLLKEHVEVSYEENMKVTRLQTALKRAADLSLGTIHDDAYTYKQKLDQTHDFIKRVLEQEND